MKVFELLHRLGLDRYNLQEYCPVCNLCYEAITDAEIFLSFLNKMSTPNRHRYKLTFGVI